MSKKREREAKDQNGPRKRKSPNVSSEGRSDRQKGKGKTSEDIPGRSKYQNDGGSPFHEQKASFYLSVSPVSMKHALEGAAAEHLSPLLLTYYPPLDGVLLCYEDVQLQDKPSDEAVAMNLDKDVTIRTQNEAAAGLVWVSATFTMFRPESGSWVDGFVNVQNEGHIGVVCWNLFNASIARDDLPSDWKWIPAEEPKSKGAASTEATGYYVNGEDRKIGGKLRFKIKDFEIVWDRERAFIALDGDLSDRVLYAGGGPTWEGIEPVVDGMDVDASLLQLDADDEKPDPVAQEVIESSGSASEDSDESSDSIDESSSSEDEEEVEEDEDEDEDQGILPLSPGELAKYDEIEHVPPGMGLASTKSRNQRKKMSRRLRELISQGYLPDNSTISDMLEWEAESSFPKQHDILLPPLDFDTIPWQSTCLPAEDWQYKIELSAIECTDLAKQLPPPPFPFRQRWHRSQKRFLREQTSERPQKKQKHTEETADLILNYDEPQDIEIAAEANRAASPDLPPLPDDIDQLPILTDSGNLEGRIIAFKRLTMVNWQPIMSGWQTAKVSSIDGDFLQLSLARRDRTHSKKKFDEETGERIWGKFEMPDNEEQDIGVLELDWSSLIEPRLIMEL